MVADNRPQTLVQAVRHFTPEVADAYVARIKWPNGPCCPKCGSVNVGRIASRNRLQCREKGCRKQFSLITGTIMEGTHLRLDQWAVAVWMIVNCRNGVSSCEIARSLGIKQQSAWHLLHRVRMIMGQDRTEKLGRCGAEIEADSTMVGGRFVFMPYERQERARKNGRPKGKCVVHAIKDRRTGKVRASVVNGDNQEAALNEIMENVNPGSSIFTDKSRSYRWLSDNSGFDHDTVNHGAMEYVRGNVHVNGCENFFNCLRMAIRGAYVKTSPEHLPAYVDESVFRFNCRNESEWNRFDAAMKQIIGKRLTYSELTDGAVR